MHEHGEEQEDAERGADHEARGDRDAVEERVDAEAEHREVSGRRPKQLGVVRLLAEMKVRRHRVLEQMDTEVPHEHEQEGVLDVRAFRQHSNECGREHEPRARRDEVPEACATTATRQ